MNRALGIRWNIEIDMFGFKVLDLNKPNTMREMLSNIPSLFDPLHFAAPVMMLAKQIMQDLWHCRIPWDQPVSGEICTKWERWKNNLHLLKEISVPRYYFSRLDTESVKLQLHHFCDASEVGYGSASYPRIEYADGLTECAFVIGKSQNAPIKNLSIPRIELQGALLAARMDSTIRKELDFNFEKGIFWRDSMIVWNYIRNESRRFQTYVANRVTEIRELSDPYQWRQSTQQTMQAADWRCLTFSETISG